MPRINPNWIRERKAQIARGDFQSAIISFNPGAQWLITYLANKDIPVVVTALGAGAKRITVAEKVCSKCKGKGYLK